jgi:glutaconate CoA-transferase subunit B
VNLNETPTTWSSDELMTIAAARHLADYETCLAGIGLPSAVANLARGTHAPNLVLVYESGTIGAKPRALPLSVGDSELAATADAVVSVPEMFNYWLQGGRLDVGFLGAAQIDRHANINSTVIGAYADPAVRLPGSGGAPEIATSCGRVIIVMRQSTRSFVDELSFRTSLGVRVRTVITDLGEFERGDDGELVCSRLHPGVKIDEVRAATGWKLKVARELEETQPPTPVELDVVRRLYSPSTQTR